MDRNRFEKINEVLINWNPMCIEGPAVKDEYASMIPKINEMKNDRNKLRESLISSLVNSGLDYDENDYEQREEITRIIADLQQL